MKAYKKVVIFFIIQCIKVNVSILEEEKDTALTQEQQIANIPKTHGKTDQQVRIERFLLKSYWKMAVHLLLTSSDFKISQDNQKKMLATSHVKSKKRDMHKLRIF